MEQNFRVKALSKKTNEEGKVVFDQLPVGQYHIEVKGTDFYLPTEKMLSVVNEEEKNELVIFVGVKPRIDTDIEFSFVKETGDKSFQKLDPALVEAKAIILPGGKGDGDERDDLDDMDEEEYEHDIIWDSNKALWVTTLKNGKYLISMKAKGYKELNEYIELKTGDKQFKYLCVPAN
jgi:cobyric acid synthase